MYSALLVITGNSMHYTIVHYIIEIVYSAQNYKQTGRMLILTLKPLQSKTNEKVLNSNHCFMCFFQIVAE